MANPKEGFRGFTGRIRRHPYISGVVTVGLGTAAALGIACGTGVIGQEDQTNTPETFNNTPAASGTINPIVTTTELISTPTLPVVKTDTPLLSETVIANQEVTQAYALTFLDSDPERFEWVDAPKHSGAVRELGELTPVDKNVLDHKTGTILSSKEQFLEAVGVIEDDNVIGANALVAALNEGIMSRSEIEAVVKYANREGADLTGEKPNYLSITPDYIEIEVWEVNRHECVGVDDNGVAIYNPDLIKKVTYRIYQANLPTNPPSLPPDVRSEPMVPLTEHVSIVAPRSVPTPDGAACE